MPKGKEVSEERRKEIEQEKEQRRNELKNVDPLDEVRNTVGQKSDRELSREFKDSYNAVRKGLVLIKERLTLGIDTPEVALQNTRKLYIEYMPKGEEEDQ